ncbi:MAG: low molecular weight phosphotyrosine protein phosphatase [Actinomycetota bacterium]|nr:low molecular weight phosphotyrosine protein phosphatase [Actinomycetota bacterium]
MPEILLVCYGNICRSPMAEVLLDAALRKRLGPGHDYLITSAGTGAHDGTPASRHGVSAMKRRDLDLSKHRARRLTPRLIRSVDRIVCMTREQAAEISATLPEAASKTMTLGADDVPDPIGATAEEYERVARLIEEWIEALADEIVAAQVTK